MAPSKDKANIDLLVNSFVKAFPTNATRANQDLFTSLLHETVSDGPPTIEKIKAIEQVLAAANFHFPATVKIWKPLLYFVQNFSWIYRPVRESPNKYRLYVGKVTSAGGHDQPIWAELSKGKGWTLKMYLSLHETRRHGGSALWSWKRGDRLCMTWYYPLQRLFRLGDFPKKDFGDKNADEEGKEYAYDSKIHTQSGKWDDHQNDHIKAIILLLHAFPGLIMKVSSTEADTVERIFPYHEPFPFLADTITPGQALNARALVNLPRTSDNSTHESGSSADTAQVGDISQTSTTGSGSIPTPSSSGREALAEASNTRSTPAPAALQTGPPQGPGMGSTSSRISTSSSTTVSADTGIGSDPTPAASSPDSGPPVPPTRARWGDRPPSYIGQWERVFDNNYHEVFGEPSWIVSRKR